MLPAGAPAPLHESLHLMSPRTDLVLRTALVVITVLVIAGLAWLLVQIEEILLAILIAAILAAGVAPLVSRLQKIRRTQRGVRLSRIAAIVLVFLGIIVEIGRASCRERV